jgi:hypothetical protein
MTGKKDSQILISIGQSSIDDYNNDIDEEELENLTHQLQQELNELDVEKVDLVKKKEEDVSLSNTKAGDAISWGSLLVTLAASGGILSSVINVIQSWASNHKDHSITLEIKGDKITVNGISKKDEKRLIDSWLNRHNGKSDNDVGSTNDGYKDPDFQKLIAPAQDAKALASVLKDPAIGDFEVKVLLNEPSYKVNEEIEAFFSDRKPGDLLLLYFSCHGIKDKNGHLYFATINTRLNLLGSTAVSANFVNNIMLQSRSKRQVLLLDCCYSGAFARGLFTKADRSIHTGDQFQGRGRVILTASDSMQYSFEGDVIKGVAQHSVFTRAIVDGLQTGQADIDKNGLVSYEELYDFTFDRVTDITSLQKPGKWVFDVQGDIVIAKNPNKITPIEPISKEITSKNNNVVGKSRKNQKNSIFISYSHKDRKWLERLQIHLKPLVRDFDIVMWDDTKIKGGNKWKEEIKNAIDNSKVAILLVSADFMASDFIYSNELPPLLSIAQNRGTIILPIILGHSFFLEDKNLNRYQAANEPSKPLNQLTRSRQEKVLSDIALMIMSYLKDNNGSNNYSNANQLWTITPNGYIMSQLNGYVLDVEGADTRIGANVIVYPMGIPSGANQLWTITPNGYIMSQLNGYVLDVEGGHPSSARNVKVCPKKA